MYYITVAGNNKGENLVSINLTLCDPIEITHFEGFVQTEIPALEKKHFSIDVKKIDCLKYQIEISPGWPQWVAYLSTKTANLPVHEWDWVVGLFHEDEKLKDIHLYFDTWEPFYVNREEQKVKYDPTLSEVNINFGDLYTMEFVKIRKRSKLKLKLLEEIEQEAERLRKESSDEIEDKKGYPLKIQEILRRDIDESDIIKEVESTSQSLLTSLQTHNSSWSPSHTQPYLIWLNSESFKFTSTTLYLTIHNLSSLPTKCSIKTSETHEIDLLPPQILQLNKIFNSIFSPINPSQTSHSERNRLNLSYQSQYTYGEVEFRHFYPLLVSLNPSKNAVFWDIGCGAAKPILTAALAFPKFSSIKGVEYLEGLVELAKDNANKLIEKAMEEGIEICEKIEIMQGDLLEVDWTDGDVIYASSVWFSEEMLEGISRIARDWKTGTKLMSLRQLPAMDMWNQMRAYRAKMSWGYSEAYVYEKIK
jgi:hypothetical protein